VPRSKLKDDPIDWLLGKFWAIFYTLVFLGLAIYFYWALDNSGWITHHRDMGTYIDGEWLNGEVRRCMMVAHITDSAQLDCGKMESGDWSVLFADQRHMHLISGAFHGRVEREGKFLYSWRCQRSDKGLECWALD